MKKPFDPELVYSEPIYRFRFYSVPTQITYLHKDFDKEKEERYYYPHKHLTYELHCVSKGVSSMNIGGTNYDIQSGEFCLITPGVFHNSMNLKDPFDKFCMNIEFRWDESTDADRSAELFSILTSESVFFGQSESFRPVLELLLSDVGHESFLSMEAVCAELDLLLAYLIRNIGKEEALKGRHDAAVVDLNRSRLLRIDEYFCSEFAVRPKAEDLARDLGVSQRQLNRILLTYYGKNFREKLSESRIAVACDMLCYSDRTIEEIADCLGYSDASNFSTFFKRKTGISPLTYRGGTNEQAEEYLKGGRDR